MTNHEWAKKQIEWYTKQVEWVIKEMKSERETIKRENAFIRDAQKDGYTFTTTEEKQRAESYYNRYYRWKKHYEKRIAQYNRDLKECDFVLFDEE